MGRRSNPLGRRTEADEVYLLGIARRAAPLERLESKHAEFQKRMMASPTLPSASTPEPTPAGPSSASGTKRKVLGETASSSDSSRARSTRPASTRSPSVNEDVFSAPPVARPNARMPVFVDPSGSGENADPSDPSPWPELGTRKARVKENVVETSKMAGTTLRQSGRSHRVTSSTSAPRMAVFRDEPGEIAAEMPPPPVPTSKKEKGKSAAKAGLAIFRDEVPAAQDEPPVPSTPKFMPFRDDEVRALLAVTTFH